MYTLENIRLSKVASSLSIATAVFFIAGCGDSSSMSKTAVDGGAFYKTTNGKYTEYYVNDQDIEIGVKGRPATKNEITAWNVDMHPDGEGVPMYDVDHSGQPIVEDGKKVVAKGSVELGNELYDAQCAICHGDFGSGGVGGYPALAGGNHSSLKNQLLNPADDVPTLDPPIKRIGSYWPYASTLFWYIKDSMPYPNTKSLSNSETYAITAYLLYENHIKVGGKEIDEDFVLDKDGLVKTDMPNKAGFYPNVDTPDNPKKGVDNVREFLGDPSNYGAGKRCMNNCIDGDIPVLRIKQELEGIEPTPSVVRDLSNDSDSATESSVEQKIYEESCSACHATDSMGAPAVGDKDAWAKVAAQGIDTVYKHAIGGFNGMPPKGGNMDLTDEEVNKVVDFMIESSK
jgi:cytochrome c